MIATTNSTGFNPDAVGVSHLAFYNIPGQHGVAADLKRTELARL
jgi:hypothetical protein